MPRKGMPWFRFYVDTPDDLKIRSVPKGDRWIWAVVLCLARESTEPGRLLIRGLGLPITAAHIADKAGPGYTEREVDAAMARFVERGMVHREGDAWVATHFTARQYESDTSTPRVEKRRALLADQGLTDRDHQKQRPAVLARDGHRCVYCGAADRLVVDHLVPVSRGGDSAFDNLATACRACNAGKAGRLIEETGYRIINPGTCHRYTEVKERLGVTVTRTADVTVTRASLQPFPSRARATEDRGQSTEVHDTQHGATHAAVGSAKPTALVRVLAHAEPTLAVPKERRAALLHAFLETTGSAAPDTPSERAKWTAPLNELANAGVAPADMPALVARFRERNSEAIPVTLQGIAGQLSALRAPVDLRAARPQRAASRGSALDTLARQHLESIGGTP